MTILKEDIKNKVIETLKNHKASRDDDNRLLATIWWSDFTNLARNLQEDEIRGVRKFLKLLAAGKLSSSESIRRQRQLLQADRPELRGEEYDKRKRKLEPQVREEIRSYKGKLQ